jgi:membrane-associated phospholipid phosphatase
MRDDEAGRWPPVIIAGSLVALLGLLLWVRRHAFPGDEALLRWSFRAHDDASLGPAADAVRFLAAPVPAVITVLALVGVAARRGGRVAVATVVVAALVVVAAAAVKRIAGPSLTFAEVAHTHAGSFPSGHVAYASALSGAAAWNAGWRGGRALAVSACATVLMGAACVTDSAHLLSDVIGGALLGVAWLGLTLLVGSGGVRRREQAILGQGGHERVDV